MKIKHTPIAAAVAVTLMSATFAAQAQATQEKKAEASKLEQVVVTGIRAARESSLNAKRNGEGIMEVITAEDVGKMPDKNVADSLQRLPGVNTITAGGTEGGFGDNDRISLRGTPPSLTYTMINGHAVGTGDWFILNQASSGRSVSYSLLPSELIDRVEVQKSARADVVEGGVAGSVNIKTRSPLNAKETLSGLASLGVAHSTLSKSTDPQLSGMINWRNEAKTFGVLAQVFSETRKTRRDGQEFFWWGSVDSLWGDNGKAVAAYPALKGQQMSLMTGLALFESERKREGGLLTAQFRPSAAVDLELSGFTSKLKADNYNRNYITTFHKAFVSGLIPTAVAAANGNVNSISVPAPTATQCPAPAGCPTAAIDSIARPGASAESSYINLDGKFKVTDKFRVETKVGTTAGKGETPIDIATEIWSEPTAFTYSQAGGLNPVSVKIDNSGKWVVGPNPDRKGDREITTWGSHTKSTDKETYAQADGTFDLEHGIVERVKFGGRVTSHKREMSQILFTTAANAFKANSLAWDGSQYPTNFGSGFGMSSTPIAQMPMSTLKAWASANKTPAGLDNDSYYKVDESTKAGYVMADLGGDGFTGNVGVRVVNTKTETTRNIKQASGKYAPVTTPVNTTEVLPSASFKFDIGQGMVLRTAIARNMSRPDFGQLGSLSLDNLTNSGKGGNPELKPIISTNFDVGAEWYFAPRSVASVALFNMDISSYISLGTFKANYLNVNSNKIEEYNLSAAQNTTARVRGAEFSLDMPLVANFGFNTNYTFASGKETSSTCAAARKKGKTNACDMLGNSRHSFNLGGYYEANGLSARLAYNYRSAFLNGLDKSSAIYQDSVGSWMASIGYELTKNLTVTFDAKDINKPVLKSYIYDNNNNKQLQAIYDNGAQYYLSLRAKF